MHTQQSQPEPDVLRARFTCWLEVLVYRARRKYLRKEEHRIKTISLDDLPEEQWPIAPAPVLRETEFDFEEERLARAFSELSVERQKLLTLVFLYDLKPEEAAEVLHYSIKKFYNNKYEALKKLRTMLSDQEDSHER
jgi:RNA polymerase sigma factor (sigma-70 family)